MLTFDRRIIGAKASVSEFLAQGNYASESSIVSVIRTQVFWPRDEHANHYSNTSHNFYNTSYRYTDLSTTTAL
jgi:hypothetical protein